MLFYCVHEMPEVLILQGRIVSSSQRNSSELISYIESIAKEGSVITIQGVQLKALDICSVYLEELGDEPDCIKSEPRGLNTGLIAGIIVTGATVFATIAFVSYVIYRKRRWVYLLYTLVIQPVTFKVAVQ